MASLNLNSIIINFIEALKRKRLVVDKHNVELELWWVTQNIFVLHILIIKHKTVIV